MTTLRIAVTQPVAGADVRRNGQVVRTSMRSAAEQGARLIHFPGRRTGPVGVLGSAHPLTAPRLLAAVGPGADLAVATLDRAAPGPAFALGTARPWRAEARRGDIYRDRRVDDPRSRDRTCL